LSCRTGAAGAAREREREKERERKVRTGVEMNIVLW